MGPWTFPVPSGIVAAMGERAGFVVCLGALLLVASVASAQAASNTDPSGDNCKIFQLAAPYEFCGSDISAASDSVEGDGTVHLTITSDAANCVGNGGDFPAPPRFGIYATGATASTDSSLMKGEVQRGPGGDTDWRFHTYANVNTPLTESTQSALGTTTWSVALPKSLVDSWGSGFKWVGSNSCIGEYPYQASDIIPNSGLFLVGSSSTPAVAAPAVPGKSCKKGQKLKKGKCVKKKKKKKK
jgi:hypothetical protein